MTKEAVLRRVWSMYTGYRDKFETRELSTVFLYS